MHPVLVVVLGADLLDRRGVLVVVDVETLAEVHRRLFPVAEVAVRDASGLVRLGGIRVHLERFVAIADGGEALAHLDKGVRALGVDERGRCLEDDLGEHVDGALVVPRGFEFLRLLLELHDGVELRFGEIGGDVGAHGDRCVGLGLDDVGIGVILEVAVVVRGLGLLRGGLGARLGARLRKRGDTQFFQELLEEIGALGAVADGAAGPAQRGGLLGGELGHNR